MSTLNNNVNEHQAIRFGNEFQCSRCGKCWHIKDEDVPPCLDVTSKEYQSKRLQQLREEIK